MSRLPLPPGAAGEITVTRVGTRWSARCWYRNQDGNYHDLRRRGRTKDMAKDALRKAIKSFEPTTPGATPARDQDTDR